MPVYPIIDKGDEYVKTLSDACADTTLKAKTRRWKNLSRLLIKLREENKISTLSPKTMTDDEIRTVIVALRDRGNSYSDLRHNISLLKEVFEFAGSTIVGTCLMKNRNICPKESWQRLDPLPQHIVDAFLESWETVDQTCFSDVRAYALVALFIGSGARTKEVCGADLADIDLANRVFTVRHPKGEGSYGQVRKTVILPDMVHIISRYLEMRSAWLTMHKAVSNALFFAMDGKEYGHIGGNSARKLKAHVEENLGVRFELRDCRRRYAQKFVDDGLSIEKVSLLLGHNNTATTERSYARTREDAAVESALELTEKKVDPHDE